MLLLLILYGEGTEGTVRKVRMVVTGVICHVDITFADPVASVGAGAAAMGERVEITAVLLLLSRSSDDDNDGKIVVLLSRNDDGITLLHCCRYYHYSYSYWNHK